MGTRHVWLALLLALLQYDAVHAGPPDCSAAAKPKSECSPSAPAASKCTKGFPEGNPCPADAKDKYYSLRDTGKYVKLDKISCDVPKGQTVAVWNAVEGGVPTPLTAKDNVVCANGNPNGNKGHSGDGDDACPGAPHPLSLCPRGSVNCVSNFAAERPCETPYKRFISKHGTEPWKPVTSGVCQGASHGVGAAWKIEITGDPNFHLLTSEDNLVCSKEDPRVCPKATGPKSECPAGIASGFCGKLPMMELSCSVEFSIYWKNKGGPWKKVDVLTCENEVWKAIIKNGNGAPTKHALTLEDNVVCARNELSLACMQCAALSGITCKDEDGCVIGGKYTASTEGNCMTMTCADDGEFWLTNTNLALDKLKCEATGATKKWKPVGLSTEVEIKAANCVKPFSCVKKQKFTSYCGGLNDVGCTKVVFNDNTPHTCPSESKIHYQSAGVWEATTANNIKCDTRSGVFKEFQGGVFKVVKLPAAAQVICAEAKPVACKTKLTSICKGTVSTTCKEVTSSVSFGAVKCDAGSTLFVRKGGNDPWKEAEIACDAKTGVWKQTSPTVSPLTTSDVVVCSVEKPTVECPSTGKLVSECSEVNIPGECKKLPPFPNTGELSCATLAPSKDLYYKKNDADRWETVAIKCEPDTGKWQAHKVGGATDLIPNTNVICAKSDPNLLTCNVGNLKSDCTDKTLNTVSGCQSLLPGDKLACPTLTTPFYKKDGQPLWVAVGDSIECNRRTGMWKETGATTDLATSTKVICSNGNPNLKPCLTVLGHKCSEAKNTILKCNKPTFSTENPPVCPDPITKLLYFKIANDWEVLPNTMHCDKKEGKWKAKEGGEELLETTNVICTDMDPGPVKCDDGKLVTGCSSRDKASLSLIDVTDCEEVAPITAVNSCRSSEKAMYYKGKTESPTSWKKAENKIVCDEKTGEWKDGDKVISGENNVICAGKDPNLLSCSIKNPLNSACNLLPHQVKCKPVTFPNNVPSACETLPVEAKFYVKALSGGPSTWEAATTITCDEYKGEWKANTTPEKFLNKEKHEIICAEQNPNPNALNCPIPLPVKSCDGVAASFKCVDIVPFGDIPDCSSTSKKLFFKQDTVTTKKWMAATSLRCVDKKWQIEHTFGEDPKNDTFADTGKIICANSNPDTNVCSLASFTIQGEYILDNPADKTTWQFEAGQQGKCTEDEKKIAKYDFITEADPDVPMKGSAPVCYPDGYWHFNDKSLKSSEVACVTKSAKIPEVEYADCASVKCSTKRFASKIDEKYQYIYKDITCKSETSKWMVDKKVVQEFACVEKMPCLTDDFPKVDLMDCPPEYVTNFGCVKVETFTEDNQQKLRCPEVSAPAPKKMFVKANSGEHWAELFGSTPPKCDHDRNKWQIDLVDIYTNQRQGSGVKEFDHENAFICADVNPNPEPTTTTTTTAPPLTSCEECNATRPVGTLCDKCDEDHVKLTSTTLNECTMTAADSNYHLVINSQEEVDALVCVRGSGKWTKKGGTEAVEKAAIEQKRTASTSKLPLILGIIIAILVLAAIGGAIAFVLIKKKKKAAKAAQPVRQEFDDPCGLTRIVRPGQPDQFVVKGKDIQLRGPLFRPKVHNKPLPMKHMLDGQEGGDKIDKIFFAKELNEGFFIGEGVEICEPDSVTVSEGKGDEQTAGSAKFEWDDGMTFSARYKKEEEEKVAKSGKKSSKSKKSKKSKRAPKQPPTPSSSAPGPSSNNSDDKKPAAK